MRVAYAKNYLTEVETVSTNGHYIFIDGVSYEMPNQEIGYELFENLLKHGYIDLREYKRT